MKKKKSKNVAGFLALFFGWFGAHRFYLGQTDQGWIYSVLTGVALWGGRGPAIAKVLAVIWIPVVTIIALVDAVAFFAMDQKRFDEKYNGIPNDGRDRSTDFERKDTSTDFERPKKQQKTNQQSRQQRQQRPNMNRSKKTVNRQKSYNKSGKEKFADYDYEGAITEFEKTLEFNPSDVAAHFNLACCHSLMENVDRSFYHLELAVAHGFRGFKKIQEHHALAYLRIQEDFDSFVKNGYRRPRKNEKVKEKNTSTEDLLSTQPDLLDQLNKLAEMRKKGFLTEKEFNVRKEKLLQNAQ